LARTRTESNLATSTKRLDRAIDELRRWHRIGARSLAWRAWPGRPGAESVADEAARLGVSPEKLRLLQRFADPDTGFSAEQFERFCGECRRKGRVPGISKVLRLASVRRWGERKRLLQGLLREGWGFRRLETEMAARLGRRRHSGGRRPRVADDRPGVLAQLDGLAERWVRWEHELSTRPVREELPPEVRKEIQKVLRAVLTLREAVRSASPAG
jgi:hypothetical protein